MPLIQTPQPVSKLRTTYKIRSPFGLFLAEDLVPVVMVDDLSGGAVADEGYPRDAMGKGTRLAGGAGTNSQVVCVGVGDRGKIYKVRSAYAAKPAAGFVFVHFSNGADITGLVDQAAKGFSDQRISVEPPDMQIGTSAPITASIDGIRVGVYELNGSEGQFIPLDVVLGFGGFVNIVDGTTNETMDVTFHWTEYLLEDR